MIKSKIFNLLESLFSGDKLKWFNLLMIKQPT